MNLKTRLAFLYSVSVFIILVISAVTIYILNEDFRRQEFVKRLVIEAAESYQLFESGDTPQEVSVELRTNAKNSLPQEKLFIYDLAFHLVYATADAVGMQLLPSTFSISKTKQHHDFILEGNEAVILYRHQKNNAYYVVATATDIFGHRKSDNLRLLLIFSVLGGILLSGLLAFFYVRQAMKPLEELKGQMEQIDEGNLKKRILIQKNNDELSQIGGKFNEMLDRLEQAFEQRKNFVQHASHELRTPLANMLAHTEAALNKNLTPDEYKITLLSLKEDQQDLIELTNSLLTLSRYENITTLRVWSPVRIDEALYQTIDFINQLWPKAIINIDFERVPENEDFLEVQGNESLIKSAIQNLAKNAIQYSDEYKVKIIIDADEKGVLLKFDNIGKQILPEEQKRLFIPFFRGENSMYKKGYGLGLSIVQRIMAIHKGKIAYFPIDSNLNRFTLFFPVKQQD